MSLRTRVTLAAVVAAGLVVALAAGTLGRFVEREQRAVLDRQLATQAVVFERLVGRLEAERVMESAIARTLFAEFDIGQVARIVTRTGEEPMRIGVGPDDLGVPTHAGAATVDTRDGPWRAYSVALPATLRERLRPAQRPAYLQVAAPLAPIEDAVVTVRRRAFFVGGLAITAAGIVAWVLAGLALRSLGHLRAAAEEVAASGDLALRVPVEGQPPDVAGVSRSMNLMLARIDAEAAGRESALQASRAFAADAAHELRTPLTSIAANVEILRDNPDLDEPTRRDVVADLAREQQRLQRTLEALQQLAQADLAVPPTERVDLVDVIELAAASVRARYPGVTVTVGAPDGAVEVLGSPEGLRVLVDNLLDNAAKHGHRPDRDAQIEVTVAAAGGGWQVAVDDRGSGIPPRDRERLLQRFERGATAAPGSGLGLAIAAQQARAHGGVLTIDAAPSGGARLDLRLPPAGAG